MAKLKRKYKLLLIVIAVILVASVALAGTLYATLTGDYGVKPEPNTTAKNVILILGNGMGVNHVKAASYFEKLAIDDMAHEGKVSTLSMAIDDRTDEAASASAIASGVKVYNGRINYLRGKKIKHLGEYLPEWDKKLGVVTSGRLAGVTPSAFLTHEKKNASESTRAKDIAESSLWDVAFGEGKEVFAPYAATIGTRCTKEIGTIDELTGALSAPAFGAFDQIDTDGMLTLSTLTQQAIRLLENENGFFLTVVNPKIGARAQKNDFEGMLDEIFALDNAVRIALTYAKNRKDTVVIVTSTHEAGDLRLPDSPSTENLTADCFHSKEITSRDVGYYAYGPGTENLPVEIDNTDIFYFISKLFDAQ